MRSAASGTSADLLWSVHSDIAHREVGDIVSDQGSTVSPGGSRDESIRGVKGASPTGPFGLVTPRPTRASRSVTRKRSWSVSASACLLSRGRKASLDFGKVHAAGRQDVALGQDLKQARSQVVGPPQVADEDSGIEEVDGQDALSVRRWARTQSLIESWSRQCG
jgi:hypothetical protein